MTGSEAGPTSVTLAEIGAEVAMPTAALTPAEPAPDRLAELAHWWAEVSDHPAPDRVEHFWSARPPATVAGTDVVHHHPPFDVGETVPDAVRRGLRAADEAIDRGADLLLLSVPIDDADGVSRRVLATHLLAIDLFEGTGWPHAEGLDDVEWVRLVTGMRDGLRQVRGIRNQPERLLTELGDPALAAGTALLVRSAARRTPVLLDGPNALASALLAHRVARAGRYWWQAADAGRGELNRRVLADLRFTPLTALGLTDEDGTAARIGLTVLEAALSRAGDRAADSTADSPRPHSHGDHMQGDHA